jgi:hypothetical protein
MDSVGSIEWRGVNLDIMGVPHMGFPLVHIEYGIDGSNTLEKTFGPNMVGGWLNK